MRIPVVSKDGKPLMPTKESRAKRWIKQGKAISKWSKLGLFYIQLTIDTEENLQEITLGLDPGSKFDGIAIVSKKEILATSMLELPKNITKKLEQRSQQRRKRRNKLWRRPCRFNNKEKENWISPSQNSKVNFRIKIIKEYKKLYPISTVIVEDVKFNHYKNRYGKHFSTVEIGKTKLYNFLLENFNLMKIDGYQTYTLRKIYNVKKSTNKKEHSVSSHAIDAIVIAAEQLKLYKLPKVNSFHVYKSYQYKRRQIHVFQYKEHGSRKREGCSNSLGNLKKSDIVLYNDKLFRVGGYRKTGLSLHKPDLTNKRLTQSAKLENTTRLYNQKIMLQKFIGKEKEIKKLPEKNFVEFFSN